MDRHAALIVNPVATESRRAGRGGTEGARRGRSRRDSPRRGPAPTQPRSRPTRVSGTTRSSSGGDGVFNEAVNGMLPSVPIGFIPGGATSVLPRALGLPRDPARVCQAPRAFARHAADLTGPRQRAPASRSVPASGSTRRSCGSSTSAGGRTASGRATSPTWPIWLGSSDARKGKIAPTSVSKGMGAVRCSWPRTAIRTPSLDRCRFAAPLAQFELGLDLVQAQAVDPDRVCASRLVARREPGLQTSEDGYLYAHDIDGAKVACDAPTPLQVDGEDLGDVTEVLARVGTGRARRPCLTRSSS